MPMMILPWAASLPIAVAPLIMVCDNTMTTTQYVQFQDNYGLCDIGRLVSSSIGKLVPILTIFALYSLMYRKLKQRKVNLQTK